MTRTRTSQLAAALLLGSATVLGGWGETPAAQPAADPFADASRIGTGLFILQYTGTRGRENT